MNIELNKSNIKIEGNKLIVELTPELRSMLKIQQKPLKSLAPGTCIIDNIGNKWLIIRHDCDNTTKVWRKELLDDTYKFDDKSNNFAVSKIKDILNNENGKILADIYKGFGKRNVLNDAVDLTSLDGLDTYGTYECKVHLGTIDDYRSARKMGLLRSENNFPFWLDTPDSTNEGTSASYVRIVYWNGNCYYRDCRWSDYGVRPFVSLDSAIFVSVENESEV